MPKLIDAIICHAIEEVKVYLEDPNSINECDHRYVLDFVSLNDSTCVEITKLLLKDGRFDPFFESKIHGRTNFFERVCYAGIIEIIKIRARMTQQMNQYKSYKNRSFYIYKMNVENIFC